MSSSETKMLEWLKSLKALDESIASVSQITRIDLSGRALEELPEDIGILENLVALNLSNNKLEELPQSLQNLQKLTNLDIRRNRFKKLPEVLSTLELRSINASSNALKDVSVLKGCSSVRVLDLSSNALKKINGSISENNEIRTLNLASNLIEDMSELFFVLKNVERLNINDNLLKEIPESVSQMESLEELDASYNHIEKIDEAFFTLDVEKVDISSNFIHTLHLHDLDDLESLTLDDNPLKELTLDADFAPYLQEFSCDGCGLKEFLLPISHEIRTLCYSSNKISNVPHQIEKYTNLEELDIDGNNIEELPDSLANLLHLDILYVNGNPLSEAAKKVIAVLDPEICDLNMKTGITIDKALKEDLPEMARLIGLLFAIESDFEINYEKQLAGITTLFEHEACDLLVAKHENKVIGMVTMQRLISSAEGDFVGQIEDLVVDEEYRKMSVGSRLLNKMRNLAVDYGYKRIQLAADVDNQNAQQFYSRRGFKKTRLSVYHYTV